MPKRKEKERFNRSALDCLMLPHGGEIGECKYFCARCVLLCLELADTTTLMHALHEFWARGAFKGAIWARRRAQQIDDELSKRRKFSRDKLLQNYEAICAGKFSGNKFSTRGAPLEISNTASQEPRRASGHIKQTPRVDSLSAKGAQPA